MDDLQARQSLLKVFYTNVSDVRAAEEEVRKFGQPIQMHQPRVRDLSAT